MKASLLAMVALLFLGGAAPAAARVQDAPAPDAAPAQQSQGAQQDQATEHMLRVGGSRREYLLFDARRDARPAPLVIALHGGGGNAGTMVPRWSGLAREQGIVVAFPEGLGMSPRMGTWNAGGCCAYAMNRNADDVGFVSALIDALVASGTADPRRIYVTGMSNGGMMTHRIAIALSDKIAGAAVVAGALFGNEPAPASPVPMMIVHGVRDQVVGFDGGPSPMAFVARSQSRPFMPVRYAVDFWARADGCRTVATEPADGNAEVVVEVHGRCRAGSEVVFYRLASATHIWPGATNVMRMLETTPYRAFDATPAIWAFFQRHARP